jgi:O-antigen ligase
MNLRIEQTNWALVAAAVGGFLFAILLGITIGSRDYLVLTTDLRDYWVPLSILLIIGLIAYVAFLQHYTWQIALLICYLGLVFRPLGFDLGPTEFTCWLGAFLAVITGWQKRPEQKAAILKNGRFDLVKGLLIIWILYASIHMVYNIYSPFRPAEFALKNALKSYFGTLAPPVLLWYFAVHPGRIRIEGNITRILALLLLTGVSFNLATTLYGIATHHNMTDPDAIDHMPVFWVNGINVRDNPYMLRMLGPTAILLGSTILSIGRQATGVSKKLSFFLLLLGSVGSLLSGGRAAVIVSIFLVLAMLLLTKRFRAFWAILILSGLFILFANVFSGWINRTAPAPVLRPLQWVMLNKNEAASDSIESSTRWRQELFQMTIDEWRSDPRIFWFGRATYGFGVSDYVAYQLSGGYKAVMEASLRRGATHNLISDLLITYGLIGCILYYCLMFGILRFLWFVYRSATTPAVVHPLALFCLIMYASYLLIATFGGGTFLPDTVWVLILLIAAIHYYSKEDTGKEQFAAPTPNSSLARAQ